MELAADVSDLIERLTALQTKLKEAEEKKTETENKPRIGRPLKEVTGEEDPRKLRARERLRIWKEKNKEPVTCKCGRVVSRNALAAHLKTKIHARRCEII